MLQKLKCKLRMHNWKYSMPTFPAPPYIDGSRMGIERRVCKICRIMQMLNPRSGNWITLLK